MMFSDVQSLKNKVNSLDVVIQGIVTDERRYAHA